MTKLFVTCAQEDARLGDELQVTLDEAGYQPVNHGDILGSDAPQNELRGLLEEVDGAILLLTSSSLEDSIFRAEVEIVRSFRINRPYPVLVLLYGVESLPEFLDGLDFVRLKDDVNIRAQSAAITNYFRRAFTGEIFFDSTFSHEFGGNHWQYWLLKINENTWPVDSFNVGNSYYFHQNHHEGVAQSDSEYFKAIRVNDRLLALALPESREVKAIFRVTRQLHKQNGDNIIEFVVQHILPEAIDISEFSELSFFNQLNYNFHEKLYPLDYNWALNIISRQVDDLPETPSSGNLTYQPESLTILSADSAHAKIRDDLNFTPDVDAFAAVIAYKKLVPPLSIGLFGHWGSGKSFFMHKLEAKIKLLSRKYTDLYCNVIIPVHFNSWHYSDANLWASLTNRIYEALDAYGKHDPGKLDTLYKNLKSTNEQLDEKQYMKIQAELQLQQLQQEYLIKEEEVKKKADQLTEVSIIDIGRAVLDNELIKKAIGDLKKQADFVDWDNINDIEKRAEEIKTDVGFVKATALQAYTFRSGKWLIALLLFGLILAIGWWVGENSLLLKTAYSKIHPFIVGIVALLSQFSFFIKPAMTKVRKVSASLTSLGGSLKTLQESESKRLQQKIDLAREQVTAAETALQDVVTQQTALEKTKTELTTEISDIRAGKKVKSFISARLDDKRYLDSLGLISWIRKDLEQLDFLLKQQYLANKKSKKDEKLIDTFKIDRIVLYIDDLDRCEASLVVKVLEAIHLLLAFPLFVVVVGVDPRWMEGALTHRFHHISNNDSEQAGPAIAPRDYLEKIFQIPFKLKEVSQSGFAQLIDAQLPEDDVPENREEDTDNDDGQKEDQEQHQEENEEEREDINDINETGQTSTNTNDTGTNQNQNRGTARLLEISINEIRLMKSLYPVVRSSPRTIKRFVNIYRIVRSHREFTLKQTDSEHYYQAAIIMLGILTGYASTYQPFFSLIEKSEEHQLFEDLLVDQVIRESYPGLIDWYEDVRKDEQFKKLSELTIHDFQANTGLIKRFTFFN